MERKHVKVWYDAEGDYLEVVFERKEGYFRETANDQVMVVALRGDYELEKTSAWDALGMRGTCSEGFRLRFSGDEQQVLPVPFAEIAGQTMLPGSHLLWASVWCGVAGPHCVTPR